MVNMSKLMYFQNIRFILQLGVYNGSKKKSMIHIRAKSMVG
jgi:hypothetical protein